MIGEVIGRLAVAALLTALVGAEREVSGQQAGLRTHTAVGIGACLFGVISTLGFLEFDRTRELTNVQIDVTRVASNVAVGVGFLGAGLIFRQGGHVRNLTTAASLWVAAAIGLAAGVGNPGAATVGTVAMVGSLLLLRPVTHIIRHVFVRDERSVRIVLAPSVAADDLVAALRSSPYVEVLQIQFERVNGSVVVQADLRARSGHHCQETTNDLALRPDVTALELSALG